MSSRRALLESLLLSRLPNEFQEVEYIESSGTQYIDSGVSASSISPIVKLKILYIRYININRAGIFGSWGANDTRFGIYYNGIGIGTNIAYSFNENVLYNIEMNGVNVTAKINGTNITGFNISSGFNSQSLLLFARNGNGYVENEALQNLYSCKIYNNDILIRNFVPCYRKADNVAGLYDLVNGVFYTNAGTGTFIVGGNV